MSEISQPHQPLTPRRIGRINYIGLYTLIRREIGRFLSVYTQTVLAPVITTLLFYTVFALAFGGIERSIGDVPFMAFLAPGLIMMTMVQNAFANTSSSVVIAKVQGNIVDTLMPPLSPAEIYTGYVIGGIVRGFAVGLASVLVLALFVPLTLHSVGVVLVFAFLGNMMLSVLGLAAGIWSEKFDHISAVSNFVITPLTFLSGTFYSIEQLPGMWQALATYNPFFYMIDGFRGGFIGQADSNLAAGIFILIAANIVLSGLCLWMIKTGYKIKS